MHNWGAQLHYFLLKHVWVHQSTSFVKSSQTRISNLSRDHSRSIKVLKQAGVLNHSKTARTKCYIPDPHWLYPFYFCLLQFTSILLSMRVGIAIGCFTVVLYCVLLQLVSALFLLIYYGPYSS